MFELTMLKASEGDCLLLSYGDAGALKHILIDGGRSGDYPRLRNRLEALNRASRSLELLVVSHIDADHIDGIVCLLQDPKPPIGIKEIWFNGFDALDKLETMGFRAGDELSDLLRAGNHKVNDRFGGEAVTAEHTSPIELDGGLKITLLSPELAKLSTLRTEWENWRVAELAEKARARQEEEEAAVIAKAAAAGLEVFGKRTMPAVLDVDKLADSYSVIDREPPNGSSIAFIAEYEGRSVLLGADAHPDTLVRTLQKMLKGDQKRLHLDLFKVSHHGSRKNVTRELLELMECSRFAVSTNGARFGHPDPEAIAGLIKYSSGKPTVYFNSRHDQTEPWERLTQRVTCVFPKGQDEYTAVPI